MHGTGTFDVEMKLAVGVVLCVVCVVCELCVWCVMCVLCVCCAWLHTGE
jgi:hypothetical protein